MAGGGSRQATLLAGFAGLAAGALSMAAGEYVSVSSQRDAETADLDLERRELRADPEGELEELAGIYRRRGLPSPLAHRVAEALTARDALGAHARDELGLAEDRMARPWQAAWASALAFTAGASVPVSAAAAPGGVAAARRAGRGRHGRRPRGPRRDRGRARRRPAAARGGARHAWGAAAMGLTAAVGSLVGAAV